VLAYASRTGTRSTLDALRAAGWRLLISAAAPADPMGFAYMVDNGAWSAAQEGRALDERAFGRVLDRLGRGADSVVCPDIVAGGDASLELTFRWLARVLDATQVALIAVQDGMEVWQVDEVLGPRVGVFVGGTTEWKIATTPLWAAVARHRGGPCHVGRVNSARRIALCGAAGATSFDGTSAVRYPCTLTRLAAATTRATRQGGLRLVDGQVPDEDRPWIDDVGLA
jgi:hypothetical protein